MIGTCYRSSFDKLLFPPLQKPPALNCFGLDSCAYVLATNAASNDTQKKGSQLVKIVEWRPIQLLITSAIITPLSPCTFYF